VFYDYNENEVAIKNPTKLLFFYLKTVENWSKFPFKPTILERTKPSLRKAIENPTKPLFFYLKQLLQIEIGFSVKPRLANCEKPKNESQFPVQQWRENPHFIFDF